MKTIYKYQIYPYQTVYNLPEGSDILKAGVQDGEIYIWAEVDPDQPLKEGTILVVGTGHELPDRELGYIDTVFLDDLVFHIYIGEVL